MEKNETPDAASLSPEDGMKRVRTYLGFSLLIVVGLVGALIYWWHQATLRANKAQQYDQVVEEWDRYKRTSENQKKNLRSRFSETLAGSLENSLADAQAATAAKNYGLALHELEKLKPWLQLGENAHQDMAPVLAAWEEAHQALEELSPDAPRQMEALLQAVRDLALAHKL